MNRTLSLLVPMLFAAAMAAQEPTESIARGFDARTAFGLVHADDGTPLAIGHDYKASFRHGAMQFVPALGTAAPTNRPLSFRLATIARGRAVLHDADAAAAPEPVVHDGVMTWSRSGILERYEARADGVAQSFVLAAHPGGSGDLVVRGTVESAFVPRQQEDGSLCFADEIGGVTIGGVTGIDANGRQCGGELRWQNGELELRLPGAFVEAAAYPLVLDPLFGTTVVYGGSTFDDGEVDVAYEAGSDTYLVVWARVFSTADHDVRGAATRRQRCADRRGDLGHVGVRRRTASVGGVGAGAAEVLRRVGRRPGHPRPVRHPWPHHRSGRCCVRCRGRHRRRHRQRHALRGLRRPVADVGG